MNEAASDFPGSMTEVDPSTIFVVIPTFNEENHIKSTLNELLTSDPAMTLVKIVVCDGESTDATREQVAEVASSHNNIHLLINPDRLQSAAINLAVKEAADPQHRILVRVDAHSHYPPGYVISVANSLLRHKAEAVATVMDSIGDSCFQRGAAWAMESKVGTGGSAHRGGTTSGWVDHGHHAGFLLETFKYVGGYDTSFVANEDAEMDHRISLSGGKIWLDATIRLGYVIRPTLAKLASQYWRYGKGRAQTVLKHRMRPRMRQMIPPVVLIVNVIAILLAFAAPELLFIPICYLLLLAGVTVLTAFRRASVCAFWVGPSLFVMHMVWGAGFLWQMIGQSKRGRG